MITCVIWNAPEMNLTTKDTVMHLKVTNTLWNKMETLSISVNLPNISNTKTETDLLIKEVLTFTILFFKFFYNGFIYLKYFLRF